RVLRAPTSALFPYTTLFRSWPGPSPCRHLLLPFGPGRAEGFSSLGSIEDLLPIYLNNPYRFQKVFPASLGPPKISQGNACDQDLDRKSTRLNSSHVKISYAV